jgi:hypothetical protein
MGHLLVFFNFEDKMTQKTNKDNVEITLKQRILSAWKSGHGGSPDTVHLLTGKESLAVIIPKALYQAEIELFKNAPGSSKILDQYLRSLLDTISDDLQGDIEGITGRRIRQITPIVDLKSGYITALFSFRPTEQELA